MKLVIRIALLALPLVACRSVAVGAGPPEAAGGLADVGALVAVLEPTAGNEARGTVTFSRLGGEVRVVAEVSGLTPGSVHAIHVHQFGDLRSDDGTSLGSHYDPADEQHGLPRSVPRHAGDLGNLRADEEGVARYELVVDNVTLTGVRAPLVGRGVVVHAGEDDGGQPVGNAGARIAAGVIGVARP